MCEEDLNDPISLSAILRLASISFALLAGSTSCRAFLNLEDPPPDGPSAGRGCDNALAVSISLGEGPLMLSGSTASGGSVADIDTAPCGGSGGPERVYAVTAESAGFLTARLSSSGTPFNSVLYAATTCADGVPAGAIECVDRRDFDGNAAPGGELLSFPMAAGETRFFVVDGAKDDESGDYELFLELTDGDDCSAPIPIVIEAGTPITLLGDTTPKTHGDACTTSNAGKDVVYVLKGPGEGGLIIEVDPTGFDVTLFVRSVCDDPLTGLTCQDSGAVSDPEGVIATDSAVSGEKEIYVWVDSAATAVSGELGGPYRVILTPTAP